MSKNLLVVSAFSNTLKNYLLLFQPFCQPFCSYNIAPSTTFFVIYYKGLGPLPLLSHCINYLRSFVLNKIKMGSKKTFNYLLCTFHGDSKREHHLCQNCMRICIIKGCYQPISFRQLQFNKVYQTASPNDCSISSSWVCLEK